MTHQQPTNQRGTRRYCYHLTPAMLTKGGYLPHILVEGSPGAVPPNEQAATGQPSWWGHDWPTARRRVAQANARLGLTPADTRDIVLSAIAATFKAVDTSGDDTSLRSERACPLGMSKND